MKTGLKILSKALAPSLRRLGFIPVPLCWHRRRGELEDYISFVKGSTRNISETLDIDLGICSPALLRRTLPELSPSFASAQLRRFVGDFVGNKQGWDIVFDPKPDVIERIVRLVEEDGERWFQGIQSVEDIIAGRHNNYGQFVGSDLRIAWEDAVWHGEIDPNSEPFELVSVKAPEFSSVQDAAEWLKHNRPARG
jgi:hypothetical protein